MDRIPSEQKDKAQSNLERGKKFLMEEYFPEERRDQFIYRGKKVCARTSLTIDLIISVGHH